MSRLSGNLFYMLADAVFRLAIAIWDRPKKKPKKVSDILDAKARAAAKTRVIIR